ncbi:low affinity immunoglobulin gamma Fc region receptor III-like protein [Lates japonicus]|nr:low affinity immunoglobulin gamma Fc region receptor III-like protein [Lates japonicus]GLD68131.1 low affinity immunoglobulin gamma Fc region receptor III-like protein [Lates japonicus]
MEVTALCFRLMMVLMVLLDSNVHSQTDSPLFLIVPNRLQFFQYESVSFHCELPDGSSQLRGIRNNNQFIPNCDMRRTLTCNIHPAYDTDSGEYWCETEGGERSSSINITVTEPQPSHHRSSDVLIPLWISVTLTLVLVLLLLLGLFHFRNHRVFLPLYSLVFSETQTAVSHSGENQQTVSAEDDADGVTYAVVVKKRRKNEDAADAADNLSLCLQTNHSRDPQTEEADKHSGVTEKDIVYSAVKVTKSRDA